MAITLTESAAQRIADQIQKNNALALRFAVKESGCSGYSYVVNYADAVAEGDVVFEDKGVTVVVDSEALPFVDGTEVDFVKNGLNEAFSFRNPNIAGECGCGESFTV